MPAAMVFAKCVPHAIEGLMMGCITSIIKFNTEILTRLFTLLILYNQDVTIDDFEPLSRCFYFSLIPYVLGFGIVRFLINRNEFVSV